MWLRCTAASNVDPLRRFDPAVEKQYNNDNGESDNSEGKTNGCNYVSNDYLKPTMFQKGVLRTNCIDCLDRTNVAQYAYGLAALGYQLNALGVTNSTKIDLDDPLAEELMGFYERMGDTLAHQYGGSAAHNKVMLVLKISLFLLCTLFMNQLFHFKKGPHQQRQIYMEWGGSCVPMLPSETGYSSSILNFCSLNT